MPSKTRARLFNAGLPLVFSFLLIADSRAQEVGLEFQAHPHGAIISARYTLYPMDNNLIHVYAGMNATDKGDTGKHSLEDGAGFGAGVGAHRYLQGGLTGPFIGARVDVWALQINWRDPGRRGTSDVTVFQPTARAGWSWAALGGRLDASLSVGQEINLRTKGEATGEDLIVLGGLGFSF